MSLKKFVAIMTVTATYITAIPVCSTSVSAAETMDVSKTIVLDKNDASPFNDTNGDGLGEFEGWGTSLCWWANRVGYDEKLTSEAARVFFSDEGLDMNIGRYNVGGGDLVGELQMTPVNPNAVFYDLETEGYMPTYSGTSMDVWTNWAMADAKYTRSDADFGITGGTSVGDFKVIGWINGLDDSVGSGDNLHYTVQAESAGKYTVKLLMTLEGTNTDRNVAIRVNGTTEYVVPLEDILSDIIASGNNHILYRMTFTDVELKEGTNSLEIGGKRINDTDNSWTLDFVKMAVVKAGEEGVLPAEEEFLHSPHITRSDSMVPGYATDVTKIQITEDKPLSWYEENFARADEECGYAWNYDWDADKNQMAILKAAAAASGEDFHAEAFSNSPPYFMTNSGCSSGAVHADEDNLRADSYNAFAAYLADVIEHWNQEGVIQFQSASPMNEPYTDYWSAGSNKQEGCHFDQGESQSKILVALNRELKEKGIDIIISGTDETNIETQIASYNALSEEAKSIITRIDAHTYKDTECSELGVLAKSVGKNLWMSEVDGSFTAGVNAGEMSAGLGFAEKVIADLNQLKSSAWILWNAIDMHVDSTTPYVSGADYTSWDDFYSRNNLNNGYWGITVADHDEKEIFLTKKYYAYGQFSRYIRPGYTIIGSSEDTLAAYDPVGEKVVIVALNTARNDQTWKFDMADFMSISDNITAIRTSGSLSEGENWADVSANADIAADTKNRSFTATVKANSITTFIVDGVSEKLPFEDVAESDWFYDAVYYNYAEGLMTGKTESIFAPEESLARAQFASILYRINGSPEVEFKPEFSDVEADIWYTAPILWAKASGIVNGYADGRFGPGDMITREQMAIMMYNYANSLGYDITESGDLGAFKDAASVSDYAQTAMQWAVGAGIISGKENGTLLDPQGETARAQCAVIIQNFMEKYEK